MQAAVKRTPTWLMVAMVAALAIAIVAMSGAFAGAQKKGGTGPKIVEQTVPLTNTGSCVGQTCSGAISATATCPKGYKISGGGVRVGDPSNDFVEGSYPEGKKGWTAFGFRGNNKTGNSTLTAIAVCRK